jgi:hypothetical protein
MSEEAPIQQTDHWFIGEDRTLRFTVLDENDAVVDITGYALEWVMRERPATATAAITKTTGSGITITDGPNGLCEVTIADADTLSLSPGTYFHTLRRTDDGLETVLSFGEAILRQAATR